ncbi:splicing factor C9orf78-like [Ornithodoros turicata]|uniref:splicing factor C9orf78-like n=1 Tax=Ornithodoros turicata TaxID=34597 RepID=UPI00313A4CD9
MAEGEVSAESEAPKIVFKSRKTKRKCFRSRGGTENDDSDKEAEEEVSREILEDTKEIQKLRKRPHGVSIIGLNLGKKLTTKEELVIEDPFKLKSGGMIDMKALKGKRVVVDELDAVNLGNTFSVETNQRDEDADMMKYIEEELAKRKGKEQDSDSQGSSEKTLGPDDVLFHVPEHLRKSSSKKSEEMLSNQMLSGIPEVDLGIEERIRNIEATEEAKMKLLKERMSKKEKETSFVPTNMAVNFVQHNRFNIDDGSRRQNLKRPPKEREPAVSKPVVVIAEAEGVEPQIPGWQGKGIKGSLKSRNDDEKATDDFHFEKFKKQFRRY